MSKSRRRATYQPLDWHFVVTRGGVLGVLIALALVMSIPFLIMAHQ